MSYKRKQCPRESRKPQKSSSEKKPLDNVISLRISGKEKKTLEKLTKATSKSVSDIMREAMELWKSKRRRLCLEV
jgi:hypothetical protein